jgi:DNA-binding PadR family transcriptional regulator
MPGHTLGPLENQVLKHLFSNPRQFIQQVQRAVGKDYKSVYVAVKRLAEKGYVEAADEQKTSRGNIEKRWRLSEKGLAYVLAYGLADITEIPSEYMSDEIIEIVRGVALMAGKQNISKLVKRGFKAYLALLDNGNTPEEALTYMAGAILGWLVITGEMGEVQLPEGERPWLNKEVLKHLLRAWYENRKPIIDAIRKTLERKST